MDKVVAVFGASENPARYSYKATKMLKRYGYEPLLYSKGPGVVDGLVIQTNVEEGTRVDTATLYVAPHNQPAIEDQVLKLCPRRVIFNPGTENPGFEARLQKAGVQVIEACTLVMLSTRQF